MAKRPRTETSDTTESLRHKSASNWGTSPSASRIYVGDYDSNATSSQSWVSGGAHVVRIAHVGGNILVGVLGHGSNKDLAKLVADAIYSPPKAATLKPWGSFETKKSAHPGQKPQGEAQWPAHAQSPFYIHLSTRAVEPPPLVPDESGLAWKASATVLEAIRPTWDWLGEGATPPTPEIAWPLALRRDVERRLKAELPPAGRHRLRLGVSHNPPVQSRDGRGIVCLDILNEKLWITPFSTDPLDLWLADRLSECVFSPLPEWPEPTVNRHGVVVTDQTRYFWADQPENSDTPRESSNIVDALGDLLRDSKAVDAWGARAELTASVDVVKEQHEIVKPEQKQAQHDQGALEALTLPRVSRALERLNATLDAAHEPLITELQSLLDDWAGTNLGSYKLNKEMFEKIRALLNRLSVHVECPSCGEPGYLSFAPPGSSPAGVFSVRHPGNKNHLGSASLPKVRITTK